MTHVRTHVGLPDLMTGIYRHYKGPLYLVLGYAHDANADELCDLELARIPETDIEPMFPEGRTVVVYVGLQLDDAHRGARLAVRTAADFHARVHSDGTECKTFDNMGGAYCHCKDRVSHRTKPRFDYIGPTWELPL
jgi:hypothetical protein